MSASATALQMSSYQVFRLMWQKSSGILTVHNFNVNPYQVHSSSQRNSAKIMADCIDSLLSNTERPIFQKKQHQPDSSFAEAEQLLENPEVAPGESGGRCSCESQYNRLIDQLSPPIFLKSNYEKMAKLRDRKQVQKLI
mmetsp:Transcript_2233/g.3864  ORF Transcript_2233/g.3864 Transcript_2233/m.3864 type:complete len:139 (+) Transcript_2233:773-1189(+)